MLKFLAEDGIRHHLAALDQAVFMLVVVGYCIMEGTDVVPNKQIACGPMMSIPIFRLQLMAKNKFEQLIAFVLWNTVDRRCFSVRAGRLLPLSRRIISQNFAKSWRAVACFRRCLIS